MLYNCFCYSSIIVFFLWNRNLKLVLFFSFLLLRKWMTYDRENKFTDKEQGSLTFCPLRKLYKNDQPTNQQTDTRAHREVTHRIIFSRYNWGEIQPSCVFFFKSISVFLGDFKLFEINIELTLLKQESKNRIFTLLSFWCP